MEKLTGHTPDLTQHNIAELAELFPAVVTEKLVCDEPFPHEHTDECLERAVDFDLLRQELSDHVVDGPQERYQLDWPGKREAMLAANAPIAKTLRPDRDESVAFDTTQNLFIEGDNLDALKLLQESYLGKVKLIYIDPPYNTGNDFIYNDDFAESSAEYLERSGQTDEEGNRLKANTESNGRFHSDWLSMMYPRLKLARNLLRDDGVICVSIDDEESASLRLILDDIFGRRNFVATIVWQKRYVSNVTAKFISDMHDFIHVYARNANAVKVQKWPLTDKQLEAYRNPDSDPRGPWRAQDLSASKPYQAGVYTITRNGRNFDPPPNRYWRCNREQFEQWVREGRIWWGADGTARPMLKSYLSEKDATTTPHTWWDYSKAGHNKEATLEMKTLFGGSAPFDSPKPVNLMRMLLRTFDGTAGPVMDFFAGSSTLAHAVFAESAADGRPSNFIQVQLPEPIESENTMRTQFVNLARLSRERIRRAGRKVVEDAGLTGGELDVGFRALRIDSTNMTDVLRTPGELSQEDLGLFTDSVKPGRSGEDLLFQVMLQWGLQLSLPIEQETVDGLTIYTVDDGALIACFEPGVTNDVIREIARRQPLRAVFRDSGFPTDADRINADQILTELSPATSLKTV